MKFYKKIINTKEWVTLADFVALERIELYNLNLNRNSIVSLFQSFYMLENHIRLKYLLNK